MRQIIVAVITLLLCQQVAAQSTNPKYDKTLADSLGGDDYGMKMYVLAILKTGTNTTATKTTIDSLFREHLNNIVRLVKEGKLIVSGPLKKNQKAYRGIFIFNVKTIEEANALISTDPAINNKLLDVELFQWYGSAALPEYLKSHEKVQKVNF